MPWFADFLTALSRYSKRSSQPLGRRILAATLSAALALGTVSPAAALAGETDSEGEGTAPPGAIEGGPSEEDETVLEEVAGSVAGGGSEDSGEGPPVESEPQQEPELPAAPEEASSDAGEALPEVEGPTPEEPPSATEAAPAYEPASVPPAVAPVENQPLSAPPATASEPAAQPPTPVAEAPAGPPPAPEPAPNQEGTATVSPPAVAADRQGMRASLAGHDFHTVAPGECLWSIAVALLPAGASNAEIAAEVRRLWKLNASRIGTGDPDLLMVGTRLALR